MEAIQVMEKKFLKKLDGCNFFEKFIQKSYQNICIRKSKNPGFYGFQGLVLSLRFY